MINTEQSQEDETSWVGPALFIVVLVALTLFFWWFL